MSKRSRNPKGAGDRLRADIVAAATSLIAEKGGEGLSLRAVARRAGITAPAIYAHFDDLDQVRDAVVRDTFATLARRLRSAVGGPDGPVARLRALCRCYVAFGREHPLEYAVVFSRAHVRPVAAPDKTLDTMEGAEAFGILLQAVRDCVQAGASRSVSPVDDATALWVGLHGYVGLRVAQPDFPWPPDDGLLDVLIDRLARLVP